MAKQLGRFKWERTIHCFTFYRVGNKWYLRQKSSLSRRRVKTSKRFVKTMENARRLGRGATLAAAVYKKLPASWKMFELYQQLTGLASQLLKEGKCVNDIRHALEQQLYDWGYRKDIDYPDIQLKKKKIVLRTPSQCRKMEKKLMCGCADMQMCECRKPDIGSREAERRKVQQIRNKEFEIRNEEGRKKYRMSDFEYQISKEGLLVTGDLKLPEPQISNIKSQIFATRNLIPDIRNSFPRAPVGLNYLPHYS
ncbi:MAG: hypothetical protein QM731_20545 [Chitinophagaceae bacterium]